MIILMSLALAGIAWRRGSRLLSAVPLNAKATEALGAARLLLFNGQGECPSHGAHHCASGRPAAARAQGLRRGCRRRRPAGPLSWAGACKARQEGPSANCSCKRNTCIHCMYTINLWAVLLLALLSSAEEQKAAWARCLFVVAANSSAQYTKARLPGIERPCVPKVLLVDSFGLSGAGLGRDFAAVPVHLPQATPAACRCLYSPVYTPQLCTAPQAVQVSTQAAHMPQLAVRKSA